MKLAAPLRLLVVFFAVAAALLLLFSGLGWRLGWWHFRTGFAVMRWATYLGGAGALLAIVALAMPRVRTRWVAPLAGSLILGAVIAYVPFHWQQRAQSVPRIHDISTDTENPPQFVAIVPLREGAPNSLERSTGLGAQQQAAYPDVVPMRLDLPPARTFDLADRAARSMGWEIVALVPGQGRIEATATTLLFGFKDDVVIRITPEAGGSRVDVRSVSRVGQSDIGANARRIRAFMKELQAQQRAA